MALVRFQPIQDMEDIRRQMNRLFEDMMTPEPKSIANGYSFSPAIEFDESEEEYFLKIEVPGMNPDDLNIEASNEAISVSGERRTESRTEDQGTARSEFRYGRFQRVIPLPGRINHKNIETDFKNGVLRLTLPKAAEEKNRVVKVTLSAQNS